MNANALDKSRCGLVIHLRREGAHLTRPAGVPVGWQWLASFLAPVR